MSPGECVKLTQRIELRPTVGHAPQTCVLKEDSGDMHLETATLAALVHKYKSDGFNAFITGCPGRWWSEPHRVQKSRSCPCRKDMGYVILK
jgi:hypothetical protein